MGEITQGGEFVRIRKGVDRPSGFYVARAQCSNCLCFYEVLIKKGHRAYIVAQFECPTCGCMSLQEV